MYQIDYDFVVCSNLVNVVEGTRVRAEVSVHFQVVAMLAAALGHAADLRSRWPRRHERIRGEFEAVF